MHDLGQRDCPLSGPELPRRSEVDGPSRSQGARGGQRPRPTHTARSGSARYPPVAVRVLVGDRAAPGVVHPAGAPTTAAAAPAPAAGHLAAQVGAGIGAGHAAQRVDPRAGASVAAHVDWHSERRSAPRRT